MTAIILMFVEFWILNLFGSPSSYHHQNLKSNPEQCHWLPPSVLAGQKWSGLINHWFPLIRPAGVALERVPLDWLLPNLTPCNGRFQGPSSGGAPSARHGAVVLVGGYVMSWSLGGSVGLNEHHEVFSYLKKSLRSGIGLILEVSDAAT